MFFNIARIKRKIHHINPKTITVDVFDTLLMRKIYPEDLQFIKHAKKAVGIFEEHTQKKVHHLTFYGFRKFSRAIIDECKQYEKKDREAHIEEIFTLTLRALLQKTGTEKTKEEKQKIINKWIEAELELEKKYLKLNTRLVKLLQAQKEKGKKIYFISDIYLDTQHLEKLFEHFEILDLFDGGICSSNVGYCKGSGKLFQKITKKKLLKDLSWLTNLHIGDNPISDVRSAEQQGSYAHHYKTLHHRPLRPIKHILGKLKLYTKLYNHHRKIRKDFKKQLNNHTKHLPQNSKILFQTGYTMGPALMYYISHLDLTSTMKKAPIVFLSSEGDYFEKLFKILNINHPHCTLKLFNRINTLRAFAYLSLTQPLIKYSQGIINLFFHGEGKRTLKDLLKSIGIDPIELGLTDVALQHMPAEKFIKRLINTLRKYDHPQLKSKYQAMLREMAEQGVMTHNNIVVADVGWNGTIQILLEQILQLLKKKTKVFGLYLGYTGHNIFGLHPIKNTKGVVYKNIHDPHFKTMLVEEIWEYVMTSKNKDDEKLLSIQAGLEACLKDYMEHFEYSPDRLFDLTKKNLKRLMYSPKKQEVLLIGSIQHDAGFGVDKKRTLVDFSYPKRQLMWKMLFKSEEMKHLYLSQYWERGFLTWYSLRGLQPIIDTLRWFKNKNMEFFK